MKLLVQLVLSILLASPAWASVARVQKADAYPGNSVRLAHHRSRTDETFWAQTRAEISRDGRYIAFDSNFNQIGNGANYTDVYVIGPLY